MPAREEGFFFFFFFFFCVVHHVRNTSVWPCGLPSLNSLGPSHSWSALCHHFQLNLASNAKTFRKPILLLFIKEKALHSWNYSQFWMFSVIVLQHYCQSNIYDKVLSCLACKWKGCGAFWSEEELFSLFGVAASLRVSFSGWCQLQHFSELSAQSACWKLPDGDAVNIWMGCLTSLSISEWSSLVAHCAVNVKCTL